jgi:hypothetical protein
MVTLRKTIKKSQGKVLIPVVKLWEPLTHRPWEYIDAPVIVVRMHDLVTPSGKQFNRIFHKISGTEGIHNYLGYSGEVILSMIMDDKRLRGCTLDRYVEAIKVLKPDFFTTLDGENYLTDIGLSEKELQRMLEESKHLINACPESVPIGLIKCASATQVSEYTKKLINLGLTEYVFHLGDFLFRRGEASVMKAVKYVRIAKNIAPTVFLYGIGSPKHLSRFFFADGFITQSHYVSGFFGLKLRNGHWTKCRDGKSQVMENLRQIKRVITVLENQQGGLLNGSIK